MTSKRRFGVSIPENIARQLEEAAVYTGSNRSLVVEKALSEFLHEELHVNKEHACSGIIIVYSETPSINLEKTRYSQLVKGLISVKLSSGYAVILVVEGNYLEIQLLRREIGEIVDKPVLSRYIPLNCTLGK